MKSCRAVSRQFLGMTETYDRFKDAKVLLFTEENGSPLNDFNFALMDTNRVCWRGVRINVFELRGQLWKIPNALLKNVRFLSLVARRPLTSSPVVGPDIGHVLNSTRQISHLQLSLLLFDGPTILADVLSHSAVAENLKNLKRLDILGHKDGCVKTSDYTTDNPLSNWNDPTEGLPSLLAILSQRRRQLASVWKCKSSLGVPSTESTGTIELQRSRRKSRWILEK